MRRARVSIGTAGGGHILKIRRPVFAHGLLPWLIDAGNRRRLAAVAPPVRFIEPAPALCGFAALVRAG
jgi:hypothetical protein